MVGILVDYGCFYIDYIGEEDITLKTWRVCQRYFDYYNDRVINKVIFSNHENSLVWFFSQLTKYLQQAIGTVPAIDFNVYSKSYWFWNW